MYLSLITEFVREIYGLKLRVRPPVICVMAHVLQIK